MADSLVQLVWLQMARNPMADSSVQSVWLQMARNPKDGLSGAVGVAAEGQEPQGWTLR